jgi:hypothetical protein
VDTLTSLRFLLGAWHGEGLVRDARVSARVTVTERRDGALLIEHVTSTPGAVDHHERIVIRSHRGRTTAVVKPDNGGEQKFTAVPGGPGVRFVRSDAKAGAMAWEVVPETQDAFRERFLIGEGPSAEAVVQLRHTRAAS